MIHHPKLPKWIGYKFKVIATKNNNVYLHSLMMSGKEEGRGSNFCDTVYEGPSKTGRKV